MWADREFQQIETIKKKKSNVNAGNKQTKNTALELNSSCDLFSNLIYEIVILANIEQYKFSSLKHRKKYNKVTNFCKTMFN